jgi:hypothetical protein
MNIASYLFYGFAISAGIFYSMAFFYLLTGKKDFWRYLAAITFLASLGLIGVAVCALIMQIPAF